MKVLKFGGTSVGSVKSILSLKRIVENEAKKQSVVIVVSALGGITDKLLQTSQLALKGDEQWKVEFEAMVDRHHKRYYVPAVRTRHGFDMLSHEATSLIYFGLVPTILASEYLLL